MLRAFSQVEPNIAMPQGAPNQMGEALTCWNVFAGWVTLPAHISTCVMVAGPGSEH
jgi:hypothetical protein